MLLDALTHPAAFLMSRLKFMGKFGLIASLFAIPFLYSVIQIAASNERDINTLKSRYKSLLYIYEIQPALHKAEIVRDLSPLATMTPNATANKLFIENSQALEEEINILQNTSKNHQDNVLIESSIKAIKDETKKIDITIKTELGFVEDPFEAEHKLVVQFHRLQSRLADQSGMLSDRDSLTLQLISFALEELNEAFYLMGKARALGIYYLDKGHVNSNGGKLLEDTYTQLINTETKLTDRYEHLIEKFPELTTNNFIRSNLLKNIFLSHQDIDNNIIQDHKLSQHWETYLLNHTNYYFFL